MVKNMDADKKAEFEKMKKRTANKTYIGKRRTRIN